MGQKISVFLEKERNSLVSINVVYTINFFFFLYSTNERPQNLMSEKKNIIMAHSSTGWQGSAGWFSLGASHAVTVRCPPGLDASEGLTDMEV